MVFFSYNFFFFKYDKLLTKNNKTKLPEITLMTNKIAKWGRKKKTIHEMKFKKNFAKLKKKLFCIL